VRVSEVTRSEDRSGEEGADLVAFNGYPDLPEEAPNPPRRHHVAANVLAAFVGISAMLVAAALLPTDESLVAILVALVPLVGGGLLTLAAWDRFVEHRRPSVGSGVKDDRIDLLASRAAFVLWLGILWSSPVLRPGADRPDLVWAIAISFAVLLVLFAVFWLAALGIGRLVQRRLGDRAATLTLVFVLAFVGMTLVGGLWPRLEEGARISRGGQVWATVDGFDLMCWGIPREPCERRARFLLAGSEAIHPDESPTMAEISASDGDRVCTGEPYGNRTCWRVD
jgi:hypothetical protein